jgi:hypothetical protein
MDWITKEKPKPYGRVGLNCQDEKYVPTPEPYPLLSELISTPRLPCFETTLVKFSLIEIVEKRNNN